MKPRMLNWDTIRESPTMYGLYRCSPFSFSGLVLTRLRQCSHLAPGHRARVLFYAGHQCQHTFFPGTHARIRAQCRCPSTRSRPCTRALNWALSPCVNTFFVGALALYPQTTCFRTHNSFLNSWDFPSCSPSTITRFCKEYIQPTCNASADFRDDPR